MKKILTLLTLFTSLITFSQTTTIVNQKLFGGNSEEIFSDAILLQNGNYLILCSSESMQTGNKTTLNYGSSDFWLINLNADFTINWQKGFGGSGYDEAWKLVETTDGGFLCVGNSDSPISGNKTAPNIGNSDFWVLKLDNLGNVEWEKTFGGAANDYAISLKMFENGDFLIGGASDSPVSGDKTSPSNGGLDYWLIRIDSLGNVIWDKTIGGAAKDWLTGLLIDSNDNIYVTGESRSDISGSKTEANYGDQNVWLVKLNDNANIIWDKTLGGSIAESESNLLLIENMLYLNSLSNSPVSGNKTAVPVGGGDFWLVKLDTNSNIIWDRSYGLNQTFRGHMLDLSNGTFMLSGDFNPTGSSLSADYLTIFIDTNGVQLYREVIEADNTDGLGGVINLGDNQFIYVGSSNSPISGDKTISPFGGLDIWLVEVTTNLGVSEQIVTNHYNLYPNPNNGVFTITGLTPQSKVEVFSIDGKLKKVFNTIQSSELQISNTGLSKGMYFAKISETNITKSIKFCVE